MTTNAISVGHEIAQRARSIGTVGFDWAMITLCAWLQFGFYLDAWAHFHRPELETFFTPWHAVLYSGFLAVTALTVGALVRNHAKGASWQRALPEGYGLSLVGVMIFIAGGVGDMIWHTLFGIEVDVEALLSPTHLLLALGSTVIYTGPLRSAWRRVGSKAEHWSAQLPMLLSLAFLLSSLTFWTTYAHPFARPWSALGNRPTSTFFPLQAPDPIHSFGAAASAVFVHALGVASVLLQSAWLSGVVLLAVRRWSWSLPPGGLTIVFTVNALLMGFMRDEKILVPAAALAGVAADLLLKQLRPSVARPVAFRLFACTVPATYSLFYFLTVMLTKGMWWSLPLWSGAIVLAGFVGWLLSYLMLPPRGPEVEGPSRRAGGSVWLLDS